MYFIVPRRWISIDKLRLQPLEERKDWTPWEQFGAIAFLDMAEDKNTRFNLT